MARLRGTGLGVGMAMGTAAVVSMRSGVAVMPDVPPRLAALAAQRRLTETPDVIVVAADFRTARAIADTLSWAKVVGIAAERDDPDAAVHEVPAIIGLAGLMAAVSDDVLILIDATRGIALIDPDPVYLAQYTAEHDRVAPKSRIYLDEEHLPALTIDGQSIPVIASTESAGLDTVLASGADALYHALPLTFDPSVLRSQLAAATSTAAGKPFIIPYNSSAPLAPLLEAASYADITLAIAAPSECAVIAQAPLMELAREVEILLADCIERDVLCAAPRIAAELEIRRPSDWPSNDVLAALLESAAAGGVTRLIFSGSAAGDSLRRLSELTALARVNLLPVTFVVDASTIPVALDADPNSSFARSIRLLIGAGVTGFLLTPDHTQAAKEAIRSAAVSECREELRLWLATA